ncbi:amino acid adenylation domain-containing protein [Micromonospora lupini]|uniref:amino acid adenylation domain-containing protein n=1 Tax=Micromonospora lupini TaxID=285679 RepID=UPI0033C329B8
MSSTADLLAQRLRAAREASRAAPSPALPRCPDDALVTSPAQESVWLADRFLDGAPDYNVAEVLRVRGPLDAAALRLAFGIVLERHEVLRTSYPEVDGRPRPVPRELGAIPVAVATVADPLARARELVRQPFDLAVGLPLRAELLTAGDAEWYVVLVVHHIAVDGWSMALLWAELAAAYRALLAGTVPALPELPVRYVDHAYQQREHLRGERLARQLDYWRQRLAGLSPLELPTDHPRPPVFSGRGDRYDFAVPDALADGVRELATRHGVTLFHALLAGFTAVLHRFSGRTDVAVGTLFADRQHPELESIVGFFGTTVVIRSQVRPQRPFAALLNDVRDAVVDAHGHRDVPFERLVEELRPSRDLSRNPLFQAMFTVQDEESAPFELPGCVVEPVPVGTGTVKFDVELVLTRREGRLSGFVEYASDLFESATVARLVDSYLCLLADAVAHPGSPVAALAVLPPAEHARITGEWNDTRAAYPDDRLLADLIGDRARRFPAAVAVRCDGAELTYGELERRANRLAHLLVDHGVGPDVTVGVCLDRTPELVVALVAVLKAGGAYVPVDPDHPADRVRHVLTDSAARLLLTTCAVWDRLGAPPGPRLLRLDLLDDRLAGLPDTPPTTATGPDDLAYLIYTSGSTGRPKGVMVPHRAIVNLTAAFVRLFEVTDTDVVAAVASHAFDLSLPELLSPLTVGATVLLASRRTATDGVALGGLLASGGVTVMQTTPTMWRMLVDAGWTGGDLRAGASGETVPSALAAALLGRVSRFWCLYGPTETTVWCTAYEVHAVQPDRPMPIGRPLPNNTVYVLDPALRPVPVGVLGEVYVGGVGVSRGYAGQPRLTAERYLPDPFGSGGRLYRSGDLARLRPDGTIEFVGRADTQVKVRGNRIELGEVEAALAAHPAVAGAAVTTWGEDADRQLVGYVVWRDAPLDVATLRAHLRGTLPDAFVPGIVVELPELPLSPNRKVDRAALPPPDVRPAGPGHVAPRTDLERLVVDTWTAVLGRDRIGVRDDFFQLGGHSLRALQVAARLRAATGVDVSLRTLFTHPTPAELAATLGAGPAGLATRTAGPADAAADTARSEGAGDDADREAAGYVDRSAPGRPPLTARPAGAVAPLSYAQRRLWFLDRLHPDDGSYLVPSVLRLRGPLSTSALTEALRTVLARHDALGARFVTDGVADRQIPGPPCEVVRTDLPDAEDSTVLRLAATDAARPFDLASGPQARARVVRVADDDHTVVLVLHHAAVDGWSLRLLWREVGTAYAALVAGRTPGLPTLPLTYADYAYWQQRRGPAAFADQLDHWRARLADLPHCSLPTDRPRPATWSGRGDRVDFAVPAETARAVRELARHSGATTFMALLAAFQVVLARFTGQDDVVVGTPVAGRDDAELEPVVGCFVNTLVLRGDVGGDPTFAGLLDRVRRAAAVDFSHRDVPFERLVEELRVARDPSRNPLFQVGFRPEERDDAALRLPGVGVDAVDLGPGGAKYDLNVSVVEVPDGLRGSVEYATDLYDAATVEAFAAAYVRTVQAVVAAPQRRLSELGPTATERRLLAQWGGGVGPTPEQPSLPELVARQAARTPDAVAVCLATPVDDPPAPASAGAHEPTTTEATTTEPTTTEPTTTDATTTELTYAELNGRANRLARWLRRRGVGRDVVVGVALPRSTDLVVALLAVLRSGGAYVAMDPAAPPGRLTHLVADSAPLLILTSRDALARRGPAAASEGVPTYCLREEWPAVLAEPATDPGHVPHPDDRAAIYYTSGSTGAPKGVPTPHRGIANFLAYLSGPIGLTDRDVVLQLAAISFDASIRDIFGPLVVGGRVVLPPDGATRDPYALLAAIERHRVTALLTLVPPMLTALATAAGARPGAAGSVRLGLVSGEALGAQHVRAARRLSPTIALVNQYGPTEATMTSTYHEVGDEVGAVPIGRPIPHVRCHVLGPRGELLPPGALGELYLGSPGLARGYQRAPGLTAQRFVPDPFGPHGARLFRTGDLVRWRADGRLIFHGRRDQQVKIRGVRVELGEVEAALAACPGVRAAAAAVHDGELAGYLVVDGAVDLGALRDRLADTLPEQSVPARLQTLDALPLTPHGKLDRARLPAPSPTPRVDALPPRDILELTLVRIWERVLGHGPIGVRDDFFAVGGHSLRAVDLVEAIRGELDVAVPLSVVFTHPTVERLAAVLGTGAAATDRLLVPLADGPTEQPPLFLVHPQGGDVACYAQLARELAGACPVQGVEAVGYNTDDPPLAAIEEMAQRYVDEIRAAAPGGPYRLAGWSFGGNVAFEMAARLEAAGETVDFLGVLDARAFGREELEPWFTGRSELERYGLIAELAPAQVAELAAAEEQEALAILLRDAQRRGRVPRGADTATLRRMVAVFTANGRAADRYAPRAPIRAPIHLFTATERHPTLTNPPVNPASWRARTRGPVYVVPVPGNHHDLVYAPHATVLAARIADALRERGWTSAD